MRFKTFNKPVRRMTSTSEIMVYKLLQNYLLIFREKLSASLLDLDCAAAI
jgi:hypothetical protein